MILKKLIRSERRKIILYLMAHFPKFRFAQQKSYSIIFKKHFREVENFDDKLKLMRVYWKILCLFNNVYRLIFLTQN